MSKFLVEIFSHSATFVVSDQRIRGSSPSKPRSFEDPPQLLSRVIGEQVQDHVVRGNVQERDESPTFAFVVVDFERVHLDLFVELQVRLRSPRRTLHGRSGHLSACTAAMAPIR